MVVWLGAGLGSLLPACDGGSSDEAPPGVDAGVDLPDASFDGAGGPRRPKRRYYMSRTETRCEVYSVEGDEISTPVAALCPPSLEVGERLRIVGRSCFREG